MPGISSSLRTRVAATGIASLVACLRVLAADDGGVKHPTPRELKDGYVGTVFSRLPDRTYTTWMAHLGDAGNWYGVSHVEDRGVEMLWLASTPPTSSDNPQPLFRVLDVVVLPSTSRADGLTVVPCRGGGPEYAVVVLCKGEPRTVVRAWTIDLTTAKFVEIDAATAKWGPLFIREDD